jgi:hypothetical protein
MLKRKIGRLALSALLTCAMVMTSVLTMPIASFADPPATVTIDPGEATVTLGKTAQFAATLDGAEPDDKVVWSVEGNTADGTSISQSGLLTVSDIEGAETLSVVAASEKYPDVSETAEVTVADLPFSMNLKRDDLVLHYTFNMNDRGASNDQLKDYSPKGNDAAISGNPTAAQWSANGFTFGGTGAPNSIRIPATANLVSPQMTLVFGLTRTGTQSGNGSLFSGKSGWSSNGLWMNTSNCYISHNGTTNTTLGTYTTVFPQNSRVEFGYAVDARTAAATGTVMLNGVKSATNVAQGAITRLADLSHYSIGLNTWGDEQLVNARFDKYMIFNRTLTEAELLEVYQGRLDPYKSALNSEILSALGRNADYYTKNSMDIFRSARRAAVNVLKNRTASAQDVDAATAALKLAARQLEALPGVVAGVSIDPAAPTVNIAKTQQFTASVDTAAGVPKDVEWTVNSDESRITQDGLLSVSKDETKTELAVTVTSTIDYSKSATATVAVTFDPVVIGISVSPSYAYVMKGETESFSADVEKVGSGSDGVTWSVDGESAGTAIDGNGELTVAEGETKIPLTVKATSVLDPTKDATAKVTPYAITGVTIAAPAENPQKGRTRIFTASVNGSNVPESSRGVTWEVTGGTSADTAINALGALFVGTDETAQKLNIKATSVKNPLHSQTIEMDVDEYVASRLAPNNGYWNTVRRIPGTGAAYANNAAISGWDSTGTWRTITGETAAPTLSNNTGWSQSAPSQIYPDSERVFIGDYTTAYRCTSAANPGDDIATYVGGATSDYADIDFTLGMRVGSGAGAAIFRYQDIYNYYYVKATVGSGYTLGKVVNGTDTVLRTASTAVAANTWYNLRIIVKGNNITVQRLGFAYWNIRAASQVVTIWNNVTLDSAETFKMGRCGLWAPGGNSTARFNLIGIGSRDFNYTLANDTFTITSGSQGHLKSLRVNGGNRTDFDFLANEDNLRVEMGLNKYLGELKFRYSVNGAADRTANTGSSQDIRDMSVDTDAKKILVDYSGGASANAAGIRDFAVSESYSLGTDAEAGVYVRCVI